MRVLHVGNIANNGYLNAKFLRRIDVAADVLVDETHLFSRPEWEDAAVEYPGDPFGSVAKAAARAGWSVPPWVSTTRVPDTRFVDKARYRAEYGMQLAALAPRVAPLLRALRRDYEPLRSVLGTDLTIADVRAGFRSVWMHSILMGSLPRLFGRYDLVQAYAVHPILTMLTQPGRPYVAFEHGTMREVPFEDSWRGRLLAVAYRRAAKVFITNPDVIVQARQLGLENYAFLPHPVDEEKYTPGPSALRREFAADDELLLFSPSRHDWDIKGNDVMLRAFARLLKDEPRALLLAADWGQEVERSIALARDLGIAERIRWLDPIPKLRMIELYRASDIVLDQFVIGTFGAIAPEAMACGTPVVMAFERELHRWSYDVLPPVLAARTEDDVADQLVRLARDPAERERLGHESRAWIERHHNWRLVAERQRAVYDEILG